MRSITALIFAHLAASPLLACQTNDAPPPEAPGPTPTPSATAVTPATATATATASATATPSTTPPATATATATAMATATATATAPPDPSTMAGWGAKCMQTHDCKPGLQCVLPFDGAHVIPNRPGQCRGLHEPMPGGRPLMVEGRARVSPPEARGDWLAAHADDSDDACATVEGGDLTAWRQELTRTAFDEHASVAAFARTICQLLALGAPAWLVQKTQRALADEIGHATRTFAWIERLGGGTLGPGPLAEAIAPFVGAAAATGAAGASAHGGDDLAAALARDVFRGGCIGETLAAHEAASHAENAPLAELRVFYSDIADDETRHAALAWETALWLRAQWPSAKRALDEEKAAFMDTARAAGVAGIAEPLVSALLS